MNYYKISFAVFINDRKMTTGSTGSTCVADYDPNVVKAAVTRKYQREYGGSPISIKFTMVEKMTAKQYKEHAKNFVTL